MKCRWILYSIVLLAFVISLPIPAPTLSQERPVRNLDEAFERISREVPEFSGLWKEADSLVVGLRDVNPRITQQVMPVIHAVLGGRAIMPDEVRFIQTRHSFATLQGARIRARELIGDATATLLDLDERNNRVYIGIADLSQETAVRSRLIALGIAESLVHIDRVAPFNPHFDAADLRDRIRPLVGGIEIERPTAGGGGQCTLGLVVKRSGQRGFLTNSHCTITRGGVEGTTFFQTDSTTINDLVGIETADPAYFTNSTNSDCPTGRQCRFSDSAFFSLNNSAIMAKRGVISGMASEPFTTNYEVVGTVPITLCGDQVTKVGRTTGLTAGDVSHTCVEVNSTSGNFTMLCQDIFEANNDFGDSGSPVFSYTQNHQQVRFNGLLWGGNGEDSVFSPVSAIEDELGDIEYTPGNDPPQIAIVEPQHGTTVNLGFGSIVTFRAQVADPEGLSCSGSQNSCTVTWTSDIDGVLGQGLEITANFSTSGARNITATVTDGPNTVTDSIALFVESQPSIVTIHSPANNATLYKKSGLEYVLHATAFDPNIVANVPCHKLTWTSSNPDDIGPQKLPKTGCAVRMSFNTVGQRTLFANATDSQGNTASANVNVQVSNLPASGPPIISLLYPVKGINLQPHLAVNLRAIIIDPDGGSFLTYRWRVQFSNVDKIIVNAMASSSAQIANPWKPGDDVPSNCGGVPATLILEATDDEGQTSTVSVQVWIPYPVC